MREIWKDIVYDGVTYEGYQVSNLGRVKSLNYRNTNKEGVLRTTKSKLGYLRVHLSKDGKGKMFSVHRLVAEAFITNPLYLPQVNHKDENKENNYAGTPENDYIDGNLEWCDSKYNINYGNRNNKVSEKLKIYKPSKPVLQYSLYGEFIREWVSAHEIQRKLGYNRAGVRQCCIGKIKTYKGYIWKYKREA